MSRKITRRRAGLLIAATAAAQTPQQSPEAPVETIRRRRSEAAAQLAKVKVPQGTDPAFIFRA